MDAASSFCRTWTYNTTNTNEKVICKLKSALSYLVVWKQVMKMILRNYAYFSPSCFCEYKHYSLSNLWIGHWRISALIHKTSISSAWKKGDGEDFAEKEEKANENLAKRLCTPLPVTSDTVSRQFTSRRWSSNTSLENTLLFNILEAAFLFDKFILFYFCLSLPFQHPLVSENQILELNNTIFYFSLRSGQFCDWKWNILFKVPDDICRDLAVNTRTALSFL